LGRYSRTQWSYDQAMSDICRFSGDEAMAKIGAALPCVAARYGGVYTLRRSQSNEAAFRSSCLAGDIRNPTIPDCSNMCHEATRSAPCQKSIGSANGQQWTMEDFDYCDAVFVSAIIPEPNHHVHVTTHARWPVSKRGVSDSVFQPAARAAGGAVHITAAPRRRGADAELDADRVELLSGEGRRRYSNAQGNQDRPWWHSIARVLPNAWSVVLDRNSSRIIHGIEMLGGIDARYWDA